MHNSVKTAGCSTGSGNVPGRALMTFQSTHLSIGPALDGIQLACRGDLGLESDSALFFRGGTMGGQSPTPNTKQRCRPTGDTPQVDGWVDGCRSILPRWLAGNLSIHPICISLLSTYICQTLSHILGTHVCSGQNRFSL